MEIISRNRSRGIENRRASIQAKNEANERMKNDVRSGNTLKGAVDRLSKKIVEHRR